MVSKRGIGKFIARFWIFIFIVAGIIAAAILVHEYGPNQLLYSDDDWEDLTPYTPTHENASQYNVVLDQHSHTLYSDGHLTVRQNIEWHISMGFNCIIITDHNTVANKADIKSLKEEYADDGIIIIQGMEWTSNRIHMNVLGITKWDVAIPSNPTDEEIQEAIDYAHDQDAVVTVNHIPWSERNLAGTQPTRADLQSWGVDYIEVINGWEWDNDSYNYCKANGMGMIAGTDMHSPGKVFCWTLLNVTTFDEDHIMTALRNTETELAFNESGLPDRGVYEDNPWYYVVRPIRDLGELFYNLWTSDGLDWVGTLTYLGYILGIFALLELYRYGKPNSKRNGKGESRKELRIKNKFYFFFPLYFSIFV